MVWVDTAAGSAVVRGWNKGDRAFKAWTAPIPAAAGGSGDSGKWDLVLLTRRSGSGDSAYALISHVVWVDTISGKVEVYRWTSSGSDWRPWDAGTAPAAGLAAGVKGAPGRFGLEIKTKVQDDTVVLTHFIWHDSVAGKVEVFAWNVSKRAFVGWDAGVAPSVK
jgi:hypothetical protein